MCTKNMSWLVQVYVPYCTSDAYSGRKAASSETGGYAFFGKVQMFLRSFLKVKTVSQIFKLLHMYEKERG